MVIRLKILAPNFTSLTGQMLDELVIHLLTDTQESRVLTSDVHYPVIKIHRQENASFQLGQFWFSADPQQDKSQTADVMVQLKHLIPPCMIVIAIFKFNNLVADRPCFKFRLNIIIKFLRQSKGC